jgi:GNAT superfamily N-acetyltransferase
MTEESLINLDVEILRLNENTIIESFDCEDKDLNDFLLNDAKDYLNSLLSVTYLLQNKDEIVAYFSLSNDSLIKDDEEKAAWNKVNRAIPNPKRRRVYPAVKIGRLAVSKKYAGMGFGKLIIMAVREMYVNEQQRSGCRFVTVDAYRDALPFYEKNDFRFLTTKDAAEDTRIMYFDLMVTMNKR